MHPKDKEKTTFMTEYNNFYDEVMSFGLKNAGATYQRLMDHIFKGMCVRGGGRKILGFYAHTSWHRRKP